MATSCHLPKMFWTCRTHEKLSSKSHNGYLSREFLIFFKHAYFEIYINKYHTIKALSNFSEMVNGHFKFDCIKLLYERK